MRIFFSCPGSSTVSWDYIRVTQKHSCQAQKKPILSQESLSAEQLRLWLSFSSWHFPLCPLCRCISGQMSMSFPLVWFLLHCEYYDFALQSLRTPCPLCVGFWSLWGEEGRELYCAGFALVHDFTLRYSFCHNFLSQSVDHRDSHAESTLFVGRKKKKKIPYLYFINVVRPSLFLVFVFALCPIDSSKHSGCAVVEPLPWYTQVSEVQLKNGYLQSQLQVQKMYAHLFPYFICIAFPVR